MIDVLIGNVHAAGKGGVSIDYENLPVIPVVVVGGNEGAQGREHFAVDAQLFQLLGVAVG